MSHFFCLQPPKLPRRIIDQARPADGCLLRNDSFPVVETQIFVYQLFRPYRRVSRRAESLLTLGG